MFICILWFLDDGGDVGRRLHVDGMCIRIQNWGLLILHKGHYLIEGPRYLTPQDFQCNHSAH